MIKDILHGHETPVWGDSAYHGQREEIFKAAPHTRYFTHHRGNRASVLSDKEAVKNRIKSGVRAHVEHPFRILKCVLGFRKVCDRGIAKNLNRRQVSCALVNLYMKRRTLMLYFGFEEGNQGIGATAPARLPLNPSKSCQPRRQKTVINIATK